MSIISSLIIFLVTQYCKTIFQPIYIFEYSILFMLFLLTVLKIFMELIDAEFFERIIFHLTVTICILFIINYTIVTSISVFTEHFRFQQFYKISVNK
jgi:hypothetical protein